MTRGVQTADQLVRTGGYSEAFVIASKDHKIRRMEKHITSLEDKLRKAGVVVDVDAQKRARSVSSVGLGALRQLSKENQEPDT